MPPRSPATAGRAGAMIVWSSAPSSITSMSPGSTRTIGARSGPPIGCRLADAWTIGGLPHTNRELSVLYGQHSPADRVAALATVRIGSSPEECGNRRSMDSEPMCQMFDRLVLPEVSCYRFQNPTFAEAVLVLTRMGPAVRWPLGIGSLQYFGGPLPPLIGRVEAHRLHHSKSARD